MSSIWVDVQFDYDLAQRTINGLYGAATTLGTIAERKASGVQSILANWTGQYADTFTYDFRDFMNQMAALQSDIVSYAQSIEKAAQQAVQDERAKLHARITTLTNEAQLATARETQALSPEAANLASQAYGDAQNKIQSATNALNQPARSLTLPAQPPVVPTTGAWTSGSYVGPPAPVTTANPGDMLRFANQTGADDAAIEGLVANLADIEHQLSSGRLSGLPGVPGFDRRADALHTASTNLTSEVVKTAQGVLLADNPLLELLDGLPFGVGTDLVEKLAGTLTLQTSAIDAALAKQQQQAAQQADIAAAQNLAQDVNQNGFSDDVISRLNNKANDPVFCQAFVNSLNDDRLHDACDEWRNHGVENLGYSIPTPDDWRYKGYVLATVFASAYQSGQVDVHVTQRLENNLDTYFFANAGEDTFLQVLAHSDPRASVNFVNQLTGDQLRAWENNNKWDINQVVAVAVAQNLDSYTGDGGDPNYSGWRGDLLMHMATSTEDGQATLSNGLSSWVQAHPIPTGNEDQVRAWCDAYGNLTSTLSAGNALAARHDALQADEAYTILTGTLTLPTVFIPGGPAVGMATTEAIALGQSAMQANNLLQPPDPGDAATAAYVKGAEATTGIFINAMCQNNMVVDSNGQVLNADQVKQNLLKHPPDCYLKVNFHVGSPNNYSLVDASGHVATAFMNRLGDVASG